MICTVNARPLRFADVWLPSDKCATLQKLMWNWDQQDCLPLPVDEMRMYIHIIDLDRQFDAALNRNHDPQDKGLHPVWDGCQFIGSTQAQKSVRQDESRADVDERGVSSAPQKNKCRSNTQLG
jgi:hypothetical protein